MSNVMINKPSAAQRQLDFAICCLFRGDDPLPVHTCVAAAHGILSDLSKARGLMLLHKLDTDALISIGRKLLGRVMSEHEARAQAPKFRVWLEKHRKRPANFLKHADRDARDFLGTSSLGTDHLLVEACCLYAELGFELTVEMRAFALWHMAVYPHEQQDEIETAAGPVSELNRDDQLEFGSYLLERFREGGE